MQVHKNKAAKTLEPPVEATTASGPNAEEEDLIIIDQKMDEGEEWGKKPNRRIFLGP